MAAALSDENLLRHMVHFEAALAAALEKHAVLPQGVAASILAAGRDEFVRNALAEQARAAGNIVIPFVKVLTERVAAIDRQAANFVHWGATSQDVLDTALILQLREGLILLRVDVDAACKSFATLAREHRLAEMPGRTWLQQAPPVTLGLKIAGWLDALQRHRRRLADLLQHNFALQFGGAVGTLAALDPHGPAVAKTLAVELDLACPPIPWHTHRDRFAEMATVLGLLAGTLGKIGRDVSLLMQTEVGEMMEPMVAGAGGSSTMPHKRNPVCSAIMLSAAVRVPALVSTMLSSMVQEHERGLGGWHAEWETMTEIFRLVSGSLGCAVEIANGAEAAPAAMRRNLQILNGAPMAEALSFELARKVGKSEAHRLMEKASSLALRAGIPLKHAVLRDQTLAGHFAGEDLDRLLDPSNYLGASQEFIENVISHEDKTDAQG
jgi:3-carboxy-cis,cis-muconate cycloisomerase